MLFLSKEDTKLVGVFARGVDVIHRNMGVIRGGSQELVDRKKKEATFLEHLLSKNWH